MTAPRCSWQVVRLHPGGVAVVSAHRRKVTARLTAALRNLTRVRAGHYVAFRTGEKVVGSAARGGARWGRWPSWLT